MKERPIIFSTPMVQAIIEGRKTQTRRVVKCDSNITGIATPEEWDAGPHPLKKFETWGPKNAVALFKNDRGTIFGLPCPYGKPGDLLWVRETHARIPHIMSVFAGVHYFSDGPMPTISECHDAGLLKKYPSIHMPKWAARIWLEITGVMVERVQEISHADAVAEGYEECEPNNYGTGSRARDWFACLWDSINGKKEGCSWADNPWVWIVEFKRVEGI